MDAMDALDLAIPLTIAFGTSIALTPLVGRLAVSLGVIDRPTARGANQRAGIPLLGGLAVATGFIAAIVASALASGGFETSSRWLGLIAGGIVLVATGVWDDRYGMSALPKLALQILAASIAIASGFEIGRVGGLGQMSPVDLPRYIVWPASLLWIVGVTNALNLLDGLDGLATGVGAIIGATLTVIAWQAGAPFGVCIGLALVGALLGFLPHNFPPARIFLGDTGSMFIGFTLSLLALEGYRRVSLITFLVPLLAMAVPILDTTLSVVRRVRSHVPIFSPDRLHMHHRLLDVEGSARAAVTQFYLVTAAFCLIALSFTKLQGLAAIIFLLAVVFLTLRLLSNLGALDLGSQPADDSGTEA
jgi:UDP-GlcNAc:undecaprenyl-phosphate GlcNAc-1-phosphate transferase